MLRTYGASYIQDGQPSSAGIFGELSNAAPGLELLVDRLRTFRTNDEFLNEIGKQPAM